MTPKIAKSEFLMTPWQKSLESELWVTPLKASSLFKKKKSK
jgi:hypothetical protein